MQNELFSRLVLGLFLPFLQGDCGCRGWYNSRQSAPRPSCIRAVIKFKKI